MKPQIKSVTLLKISENTSSIEIKYFVESQVEGIELMGVDAGLEWVQGESIEMIYEGEIDELHIYSCILEVEISCEFRARAYSRGLDYWEEESNHTIERQHTGQIELITESYVLEKIDYFPRVPVNYEVEESIAILQVEEVLVNQPELLQLLFNLTIWIKDLLQSPYKNIKLDKLSDIIRYLKIYTREYDSQAIDELVRPVYLSLTELYISIATFSEDDIKILESTLDEAGYKELFIELPQKIKDIEFTKFESHEESNKKFTDHLKYI